MGGILEPDKEFTSWINRLLIVALGHLSENALIVSPVEEINLQVQVRDASEEVAYITSGHIFCKEALLHPG